MSDLGTELVRRAAVDLREWAHQALEISANALTFQAPAPIAEALNAIRPEEGEGTWNIGVCVDRIVLMPSVLDPDAPAAHTDLEIEGRVVLRAVREDGTDELSIALTLSGEVKTTGEPAALDLSSPHTSVIDYALAARAEEDATERPLT